MTTYFEYGVTLTDGQKSKLLSSIKNTSPLTIRLKHSHLRGSDELMLTQRQIHGQKFRTFEPALYLRSYH